MFKIFLLPKNVSGNDLRITQLIRIRLRVQGLFTEKLLKKTILYSSRLYNNKGSI